MLRVCVCVCVCVCVQTAEKFWLSCFVTVESRSDVRLNFTFSFMRYSFDIAVS